MAAARFAAVLLVAFGPLSSGQQTSTTLVTVQVTDATGAPIPGALVDITTPCGDPIGGETSPSGQIGLYAVAGLWETMLTVTSPGLCPESRKIEIRDQATQIIPVKMRIGGCPSKCTPICLTAKNAEVEKPAQGRVIVQVTDTNGGVLPDARVEIDPSPPTPGPFESTDSQGRATFDLPGGAHSFVVTGSGFKKWSHRVNVSDVVGMTVHAMLRVEPICDVVVQTSPDIPPPTSGEQIFLLPKTLLNLDPLPSRPAKRRQ
jgi:hypothetical protein